MRTPRARAASMGSVLFQIVLLDIVFSLDSVLTAVGMADEVAIMIAAVVIAVGVMLVASGPLARFVHAHPTVKMLALAFLLLIGVTLVRRRVRVPHREGVHLRGDGRSASSWRRSTCAARRKRVGAGGVAADLRQGRGRAGLA